MACRSDDVRFALCVGRVVLPLVSPTGGALSCRLFCSALVVLVMEAEATKDDGLLLSHEACLSKLQDEQVEWVQRNFGDRPAWMPLMGICEEVGEWYEACSAGWTDAQMDALADIVIFASDYCTAQGWSLAEVWTAANDDVETAAEWSALSVCVGRLQHHHLKSEQGIRGGRDRHRLRGKAWLVMLIRSVRILSERVLTTPLVPLVWRTWESVRQRDWRTSGCQRCGTDGNGCKCPGDTGDAEDKT